MAGIVIYLLRQNWQLTRLNTELQKNAADRENERTKAAEARADRAEQLLRDREERDQRMANPGDWRYQRYVEAENQRGVDQQRRAAIELVQGERGDATD
jgi:hypothetical protein